MLRLQLLGGIQLSASDGRDLRPLLGRPKRLALLAYLAARERGTYVRRDSLTALLWPEMDQSGARKAIRQALYVLRTELGEDVFETAGDDELRVAPERLWCDVPEFLTACKAGRHEEALELYRGDLMPAFFVPDGGAGFEQWLEEERGRLRGLAAKAAWDLAEGAERNRKSGPAATFGRQALSLTHDDETALRRLIQLLDRMGDRAGAVRAYETFARRLKEEYGDDPSAETQALIARVREREVAHQVAAAAPSAPPNPAPPAPSTAPPSASEASTASSAAAAAGTSAGAPVRRRAPLFAALAVVALLAGAALWNSRRPSAAEVSRGREVGTTSAEARQHYRRGVELWYAHGNRREAIGELRAALAADSTFAMAAYWLARVSGWEQADTTARYLAQAVRMAPHATVEEQRLIELWNALNLGDPRALPLAELLATQFPRDPEVLVLAAQAAEIAGRYDRASELARQIIALDTGVVAQDSSSCPVCQGYRTLVASLVAQDSLEMAERVARAWRAARPGDVNADKLMASVLDLQGRYGEARAINQQLIDRGWGSVVPYYLPVSSALRQGDLAAARRVLAQPTAADSAYQPPEWPLLAVLRHAGQLREAQRVVRRMESSDSLLWIPQRMEVGWEAGDTASALAIVRPYLHEPAMPSGNGLNSARSVSWMLLRGSTYFASIGDTAALALIATRLQQVGQLSAMGRDQRGYHYPLGLLALARGDTARAEAEFRAAVLSASEGYTRINFQLGRLLLDERRPSEAIAVLRPILDADFISGSTFYVTATEVHEALGQAYAALNQPDSAGVHFGYVARVWASADPRFQPRLSAAVAYLAAHPAR